MSDPRPLGPCAGSCPNTTWLGGDNDVPRRIGIVIGQPMYGNTQVTGASLQISLLDSVPTDGFKNSLTDTTIMPGTGFVMRGCEQGVSRVDRAESGGVTPWERGVT